MNEKDYAHELTENIIKDIEKRVSSAYKTAAEELRKETEEYFAVFAKADEEKKRLVERGEITREQYQLWRKGKIMGGESYKALQKKLSDRFTHANELTISYINEILPKIYALNFNWTAYEIEKANGELDFTIFNEDAVRRLLVEDPDLLPYYPKELAVKRGIDLAYGREQITKAITSGILQGKAIEEIANDILRRLRSVDTAGAVRAARTAATSAQNAGRQAGYKKAAEMGIDVKKRWNAAKDNRTRDAHKHLDGQVVPWDKPFKSDLGDIMYPGDRNAAPSNVWNCRCTMGTVEKQGIEVEPRKIRVRDTKTGKNVVVSDMTYSEWEEWAKSR